MLTELRAIEHAKRDAHATEPLRRPRLGAALAIATLVVLAIGLIGLPRDNASLPDIARYALEIALPQWKTTEPVNEIVYGSRGFDTFGETFLLLAAVVSVVTLARPREPRREYVGEAKAGEGEQARIDPDDDRLSPSEAAARRAEQVEEAETGEFIPADRIPLGTRGAERSPEMSVVVRIAARTVARLLAVTAVYLVAWGYSPGGGFPGGAALAGVVVLLYAALGYRRVRKVVRPGERCCRPSTVCSWTQPAAAATPVGFAAPLSHNRGISTSRRTVLRRCTLQSPRPYRICDTSNGSSITPDWSRCSLTGFRPFATVHRNWRTSSPVTACESAAKPVIGGSRSGPESPARTAWSARAGSSGTWRDRDLGYVVAGSRCKITIVEVCVTCPLGRSHSSAQLVTPQRDVGDPAEEALIDPNGTSISETKKA